MVKSYTERYVNYLRKLVWNTDLPNFYTTLQKGEDFPTNFYHSVQLINSLAVVGNIIYHSLPNNHPDRDFLDYFMGVSYLSEQFIWNQPGLIQCYYREGVAWQRGTVIDPSLPVTSNLPVLSSSVTDCVIALILKYIPDESSVLWLAAEQQNYASTSLFTREWSYPVDTESNPIIFVNADGSGQDINPHRLIFNWLSLGVDLLAWNRTTDKSCFTKYLEIGRIYWEEAKSQVAINLALLSKIPQPIPIINQWFSWGGSGYLQNKLVNLIPTTLINYQTNLTQLSVNAQQFIDLLPIEAIQLSSINLPTYHKLGYYQASSTLKLLFYRLEIACYNKTNYHQYCHEMNEVVNLVKRFYTGVSKQGVLFWNPRVRCA
jgi:hypothetical protein